MSVFKVKVQWGKNSYDVELDVAQPVEVLKAQLNSLTGVPSDRQKIMAAGKMLKDDTVLSDPKLAIKDGIKLTLMGTAEAALAAPTQKIQFLEDLPPEELAKTMLPSGLVNLGNTCYLNSALQTLRYLNPLRAAMQSLPDRRADPDVRVATALNLLLGSMDKTPEPVQPMYFLQLFRQAFPQFDQTGEGGRHMQQDSEEAFTAVLQSCSRALSDGTGAPTAIDNLFDIELSTRYQCAECDSEPAVERLETEKKLRCNVNPNSTTLEIGLQESLADNVEKRSEVLGRSAVYAKTSKLTKLPEFLVVQIVRFYFRKDNQQKTKQLRPIMFPFTLDVFPMCSDDLKGRIKPGRDVLKRRAEKEAEEKRRKKQAVASEEQGTPMHVDEEQIDTAFLNEMGNQSAFYELYAVITHKGREADGGHYVAWVKKGTQWLLFDDEKVFEKDEEEVRKTAGGAGDWHLGYLLLYRTRNQQGYVCGPP